MIDIVSYSGGADSTALLTYYWNKSLYYDEVIYVQDWIPYPDKKIWEKYFDYIEKMFNIKITRLKCDRKYWIKKNGGHHPRLPHPYCCRIKGTIFGLYCKEKYGKEGINILMGIRKHESTKRSTYPWKGNWYLNKRLGVNYTYEYPIFDFLDSKHYCNINGVKINPLYKKYGVKRLGCYKCYKCGDFSFSPEDENQIKIEGFL